MASSIVPRPRALSALALPLALALGGCGGAPQPAPAPAQPIMGKSTPEARAAFVRTVEQSLAQCDARTQETNTKLAEVVDKLAGGKPDMAGKPTPPLPEVIRLLAKEKVTVELKILGTAEAPMLMLEDSFMKEGQKLAGAKPKEMQAFAKRAQVVTPLTTTLRDQIFSVNAALGTSLQSQGACVGMGRALPMSLGAWENGGEEVPPEVFAAYAKFLQANARNQAVVAASVALVGVTQAGFAGKDPKAIEVLLEGIKVVKDNPEQISEAQARAVYKAAGQSLIDMCQANLDKYYAEHPEAKKPDGPSPCSKEGLAADREKWNRGPGAPESDASAPKTGIGVIDETVERLVRVEGALKDASAAIDSLKNGDYVGGLKGALKLVGKNVPFGNVLQSVLDLFG
jgi:hypothetical protein